MKFLIVSLIFAAGLNAFAKDKAPTVTTAEPFKLVKSNDVVAWMKQNPTSIHIFDANNEKTRKNAGVVHGATILPTSSGYDVATLPTDKNAKLVFYCANEKCMASHDAAKRAAAAGYKDVNVMSDGIDGWKKSGQPTDKI